MHDLVVIGGGGAGLTAALTAKKLNWEANITLISNTDVYYSPCALPFVISGEIPHFDNIIHNLKNLCEEIHINCVIDTAVEIDINRNIVKTESGKEFGYKSLIIATGGIPRTLNIEGSKLDGIFTLQKIEDAKRILERVKHSRRVAVIGGGAIGVEIASALRKRCLEVTLIEKCDHLFPGSFDTDFSDIIRNALRDEGITIITGRSVDKFVGDDYVEGVLIGNYKISVDMVVLGVGLKPNAVLAERAGIKTVNGAIQVDGWMQTNVKGVYAAGDCIFTKSLVTGRPTLSQLGTSAIRQGRVAGTNAVGGYATIEGVLNSMILKIFDLEMGRTGLTEKEAKESGIEIITGKIKTTTKAPYFPGAEDIFVKLVFNKLNRKLIGAQIVGGGEGVADKIDLCAFAIQNYSTMDDLMKLKYCYTPPLTPINNAIVDAAENAYRKLARLKEIRRKSF